VTLRFPFLIVVVVVKPEDRRRSERFQVALPVVLPSAQGVTRDVSLSGVLFDSPVPVDVGGKIEFNVVLGELKLVLHCEATVIRVTPNEAGNHVAARVDALECVPDDTLWH